MCGYTEEMLKTMQHFFQEIGAKYETIGAEGNHC
jgi:hypothetical protein